MRAVDYLFAHPDGIAERAEALANAYEDLLVKRQVASSKETGAAEEKVVELVDESYFEVKVAEADLRHLTRNIYDNANDLMDLEDRELCNGDTLEEAIYGVSEQQAIDEITGENTTNEAVIVRLRRIRMMQAGLQAIIEDEGKKARTDECA